MIIDNAKIAVIGLGYVGLPLAIEFAKLKYVVGFDINEDRIQELKNGLDRTLELDAQQLQEIKNKISLGTNTTAN